MVIVSPPVISSTASESSPKPMTTPNSAPSFDFITPTPIDKPNDNGERGTGYDYRCDLILRGLEVPAYPGELVIEAPFSFQVAGHDPFLKAGNGLVCKPYAPRELWFYLQLQHFPHFKPFVADFLGCVEFTTETVLESVQQAVDKPRDVNQYITPWAEKIHRGHLKRMSSARLNGDSTHRYLVLRDMTYTCSRPCVMDLKIGIRAYGDDATDKKRQSQTEKSKNTTSFSTGLRICGCQGYSLVKGDYWQLHKYEGRKLTKETLPLAFYNFFHSQISLRKDVIKIVIDDLYKILDVVKREEFRLYSSSLLLVYDAVSETPKVFLKMIDFSHTFSTESKEIDDGYVFGIKNLIHLLENLLNQN